jgi:hypothetical protein
LGASDVEAVALRKHPGASVFIACRCEAHDIALGKTRRMTQCSPGSSPLALDYDIEANQSLRRLSCVCTQLGVRKAEKEKYFKRLAIKLISRDFRESLATGVASGIFRVLATAPSAARVHFNEPGLPDLLSQSHPIPSSSTLNKPPSLSGVQRSRQYPSVFISRKIRTLRPRPADPCIPC